MGVPIACSLVDVTIPDDAYEHLRRTPEGKVVNYIPSAKMAALAESSVGAGLVHALRRAAGADGGRLDHHLGRRLWPSFAPTAGGACPACSLVGLG